MTLYCDDRETTKLIVALRKLVDNVEVSRYGSGDYVFGDIGVERKELTDALNSVNDGRYFKQIQVLKDTYKKPLVLFEGVIDDTEKVRNVRIGRRRFKKGFVLTDGEKQTLRQIQHSTILGWGIPIIQSTDIEDTARRIAMIYNREMGYTVSTPPGPAVKKSVDVKEIRYNMVCCVDGIGGTLGKRILKVTPTFSDIRDMGAETLCKKVDKLPLKRAKMLVEAVR